MPQASIRFIYFSIDIFYFLECVLTDMFLLFKYFLVKESFMHRHWTELYEIDNVQPFFTYKIGLPYS